MHDSVSIDISSFSPQKECFIPSQIFHVSYQDNILIVIIDQVMREYTSKVDKLEEAEQERVTEAKEEKSKPIVMGKFLQIF